MELIETTKDDQNNDSKLINVVVNSKFYREIVEPSYQHKRYIVYVAIPIIMDNFNINLDLNFTISLNKKFQMPFSSILNPIIPKNSIVSDLKTEKFKIIQNNKEISKNRNNIVIRLDIFNEIINIEIKLINLLNHRYNPKDVKLKMNNDCILLLFNDENQEKFIKEYYLPIDMKYELASAKMKRNILIIKCPVIL